MHWPTALAFLSLFVPLATAQSTARTPDPAIYEGAIRFGPGVTAPHVLRKVDPELTAEARSAHVQGTAVCEFVVAEKGRAEGITVISPLGYGLDEVAVAALAQWSFSPAKKNGQPVKFIATLEVNFQQMNGGIGDKTERQRTSFNLSIKALTRRPPEPQVFDKALRSMTDLANQGYPPAMTFIGQSEISGENGPRDPAHGLEMIQKAAAKNYGPALYEIAIREIEGRDLALDPAKGLERMRRAANFGSLTAQAYLGQIYFRGVGVPRDPDKARNYFRLCAARGNVECQFRLAEALLDPPSRLERDLVQAVAWLELAADKGHPGAKEALARESAALTPAQTAQANKLKPQLVH